MQLACRANERFDDTTDDAWQRSTCSCKTPSPCALLQKGQKQLRVAAVKLAAMHPPADVKADHAALTQAVREYASELSMVISEVKSGSTGDLGSIASLKGVLAMEKASQAITAKGYAIL